MPIYKVKTPLGDSLVLAESKSRAIRHALKDSVSATAASAEEVALAMQSGVTLETAQSKPKKESEVQ